MKELVNSCIEFLQSIWGPIKKKFNELFPSHPLRTITIAYQNRQFSCYWSLIKEGENERMHIEGNLLITNISHENIQLSRVVFNKKRRTPAMMLTITNSSGINTSDQIIPPNIPTKINFIASLDPVVRKKGEEYVEDISVVDSYGNDHWFKNCRFVYR